MLFSYKKILSCTLQLQGVNFLSNYNFWPIVRASPQVLKLFESCYCATQVIPLTLPHWRDSHVVYWKNKKTKKYIQNKMASINTKRKKTKTLSSLYPFYICVVNFFNKPCGTTWSSIVAFLKLFSYLFTTKGEKAICVSLPVLSSFRARTFWAITIFGQ